MASHRIRLPQPWGVTNSSVCDPNRADVRITTHEFQRNFQRPSGLSQESRIELEVGLDEAFCAEDLSIYLNDQLLTMNPIDPENRELIRAPIALSQLANTNKIRMVIVSRDPAASPTLPPVALVLNSMEC